MTKIRSEGWFPEDSWLDRLDKAISLPIFRLRAPFPVEAVLAVPGSMFGVCVQSLIMLPCALPLILSADLKYFLLVAVPVNLWGSNRVSKWLKEPKKIDLVIFKLTVPFNGFFHAFMASLLSEHPDAPAAVCFYFLSWFYGQLVTLVSKNFFWRLRPFACLPASEFAARTLPQFRAILENAPSTIESFPSSDATGAGAFGFVAATISGNWGWLGVTLAGCFGRVYFQMHHVGDVLAGAVIGVLAGQAVDALVGGWQRCVWWQLATCTLLYATVLVVVLPHHRRKKKAELQARGMVWKDL